MIFNSKDETLTYLNTLLEKDISIYQEQLNKVCELNGIKINEELFTLGDSLRPKLHSVELKDDKLNVVYEKKSWIKTLPSLYHENEFLKRFLHGIEHSHYQIEKQIDNMADQFSAQKTEFVDWLSSWLGITISNNVDEIAKRKLLSDMVRLYGIRGTKQYFIDIIKHLCNVEVRIEHAQEYRTLHHNLILKDTSKKLINIYIDENLDTKDEERKISFIKSIMEHEKPIGTSYKIIYKHKDPIKQETLKELKEDTIKEDEKQINTNEVKSEVKEDIVKKEQSQKVDSKSIDEIKDEEIEKEIQRVKKSNSDEEKLFDIDNEIDEYYSYDDLE